MSRAVVVAVWSITWTACQSSTDSVIANVANTDGAASGGTTGRGGTGGTGGSGATGGTVAGATGTPHACLSDDDCGSTGRLCDVHDPHGGVCRIPCNVPAECPFGVYCQQGTGFCDEQLVVDAGTSDGDADGG